MISLFVELLSFEANRLDFNFEKIIIMALLNHDGRISILDSKSEITTEDETRGLIRLDFSSHCVALKAHQILKNRGYHVQ